MNRLQKEELKVAKEFKRICELLGINYFLDYGSLLGAVRHQGFIPWDDDMDFGMMRSDYEKFIHEAPGLLDEKFFLQTYQSDAEYGAPYAKLRLNGTKFIEGSLVKNNAHKGIFIDIFPYDDVNPNGLMWKLCCIKLTYYRFVMRIKNRYTPWIDKKFNLVLFILYIPLIICSWFYNRNKLFDMYCNQVNKVKKNGCQYIFPQDGDICGKVVLPKSFFNTYTSIKFEDTNFMVPTKYDGVLTHYYGNYMQLPPEDKRGSTHHLINVEFGDDGENSYD